MTGEMCCWWISESEVRSRRGERGAKLKENCRISRSQQAQALLRYDRERYAIFHSLWLTLIIWLAASWGFLDGWIESERRRSLWDCLVKAIELIKWKRKCYEHELQLHCMSFSRKNKKKLKLKPKVLKHRAGVLGHNHSLSIWNNLAITCKLIIVNLSF